MAPSEPPPYQCVHRWCNSWAENRDAPNPSLIRLRDVLRVDTGLSTPVLKRSGTAAKADQYCSLILVSRSIDIEVRRARWCHAVMRNGVVTTWCCTGGDSVAT